MSTLGMGMKVTGGEGRPGRGEGGEEGSHWEFPWGGDGTGLGADFERRYL